MRISDPAIPRIYNFRPDDVIEADSPLEGTAQISPFDAIGGFASSRAVAACLYSDGSGTRRVQHTMPFSLGGLPLMILRKRLFVPTSSVSTREFIFAFTDVNTSEAISRNWDLRGYLDTNSLILRQNGTTSETRSLSYSTFRTAYSGQYVDLAIHIPGDATSGVIVWVNGVDVSAQFAETVSSSPPTWNPSNVSTPYFNAAMVTGAGRFYPTLLGTGVFSTAEVEQWVRSGELPTWFDVVTGNITMASTASRAYSIGATDTNTTSDAGGNDTTRTAEAGARDGGAGSWFLRGTVAGAGGNSPSVYATFANGQRGARHLVSVWARVSLAGDYSLSIGSGGGQEYTNGAALSLAADVWTKVVFSSLPSASVGLPTRVYLRRAGAVAAGVTMDIDDLEVGVCGKVIHPLIQPGRHLIDISGNKIHGVLTGLTAITDQHEGQMAQTGLAANGELTDTAGTIPTDAVLVDVVVRNTTANTVTRFGLGMTSGVRDLTYETDIGANETVILPIKRADLAGLTVGTAPYGRIYYSADSWSSGTASLNISIRYRRERGI